MGSSCQMCYQAGHMGNVTAPGTWAPEQSFPSLVCLLLKRGQLFCQLNSFTGRILLLAAAFPTVLFALLLEFHALLFSEHPKLSPQHASVPWSLPSGWADEGCPSLKAHTPTPTTSPMSKYIPLYQE